MLQNLANSNLAQTSSSALTPGQRLGQRPALDGIRGLFFLVILVYHSGLYFTVPGTSFVFIVGGFMSVDSFYVMSGFLITTLLLDEWERKGRIQLSYFYARRALRLLPGLFFMMLAYALYLWRWATPDEARVLKTGMMAATFYYANLAVVAGADLGTLLHTWSLSLEEQFYIVWPLLLVLLLKRKLSQRAIIMLTATLIAAICLWRAFLFAQQGPSTRLLFSPDTRADALLVGCLLALLWSWNYLPTTPRGKQVSGWVGTFSALFLLYIFLRTDSPDPYLYARGGFTWVAFGFAGLIWGLLEQPLTAVRWVLENRFIVWCGKTSYSLYLWHVGVLYLFKIKLAWPWTATTIALAWASVFLLAGSSFYLIERPCLRLKKRFAA